MRKGYVFSLLVALLLGYLMFSLQYYLVDRPAPGIDHYFSAGRDEAVKSVADGVAAGLNFSVARSTHVTVTQALPISGSSSKASQWTAFLTLYTNATYHNMSLDTTNSTLDTTLWLAGSGVDYVATNASLSLNHSGSYLFVENTMGTVNYSSCTLDNNGTVATRIKIDTFDTGAKYTTPGTTYNCFVNFTTGKNVTVTVRSDGGLFINYSNAPASFTQRISFDSGPLYVVFAKYNTTLSAVNPGWNESFTGTKKYGTANGINFVVADADNDTKYDYAFADADGNGNFSDAADRWFIKEGVASLNGKGFYMRFDLTGNWLAVYKALTVGSASEWKGVEV